MDQSIKTVDDISKIRQIIGRVKSLGRGLNTNFFPNTAANRQWIEQQSLFSCTVGDISLLIHTTPEVSEIYYFSPADISPEDAINSISEKIVGPAIVEVIKRDKTPAFSFPVEMIIQRYYVVTTEIKNLPLTHQSTNIVTVSSDEYLSEIHRLLTTEFNPVAERIPSVEQLKALGDNNCIYVAGTPEKIEAFVIAERNHAFNHLRYWWVSSNQRGKGIGSSLLRKYLMDGADCQKSILWVDLLNSTAINAYRHFGFSPENLYDIIYRIK